MNFISEINAFIHSFIPSMFKSVFGFAVRRLLVLSNASQSLHLYFMNTF